MFRVARQAIFFIIIVAVTSGCATCPPTLLSYNDLGVATFLPGDQNIVVVLHSGSFSHLYNIKVDGTELSKLSENLPRGFDHAFSPDGTLVSFYQVVEGQGDIYAMKLDGSNRVCLTSGPEHDFEPVFSPDGSKIYFLRAQTFEKYSPIARPAWHKIDVYSITIDGTELKRITFENAYSLSNLSIHPKGDTLMILGRTTDGIQLLMIPINDQTNKRTIRSDLTTYRERFLLIGKKKIDYNKIRNPRFSPDGNHILFSWPYFNGLYNMDLQTNLTKKIWSWEPEKAMCDHFGGYHRDGTPIGQARQMGRMYPRFSSDGRQVVFNTSGATGRSGWESKLWVIDVDGTGLRSVEMK